MAINTKYIVLFIFFTIPMLGLMMKVFNASSMILGTLFFSSLFFSLYIFKPIKIYFSKNYLLIYFVIFIFIFFISTLSFMQHPSFEYKRFIGSYFLIIYLLFTAFFVSTYLKKIESLNFYRTINSVFYMLLFDGIYSTIEYIFIGEKETIFFSEPSHFAFIILPFFLFKLVSNKQVKSTNFFIIISMLIVALFFENLTLLIGTAIAILITSKLKYFTFSFLVFILLIMFIPMLNVDYFLSRLTVVGETTNLSVLVFLSGWERALLNLKETYGIGIGFNQLGYVGSDGMYISNIYDLCGIKLNYNDGGTTGSKIISELGIFGLTMLIVYSYFAVKFIFFFKNTHLILDSKDIFFLSIFIMFGIELFIRGAGYFTLTAFLFLVSIFYLTKYTTKKIYLGES